MEVGLHFLLQNAIFKYYIHIVTFAKTLYFPKNHNKQSYMAIKKAITKVMAIKRRL